MRAEAAQPIASARSLQAAPFPSVLCSRLNVADNSKTPRDLIVRSRNVPRIVAEGRQAKGGRLFNTLRHRVCKDRVRDAFGANDEAPENAGLTVRLLSLIAVGDGTAIAIIDCVNSTRSPTRAAQIEHEYRLARYGGT